MNPAEGTSANGTTGPTGSGQRSTTPTDEPVVSELPEHDALWPAEKAKPWKSVGLNQDVVDVTKILWERIEKVEYPPLHHPHVRPLRHPRVRVFYVTYEHEVI